MSNKWREKSSDNVDEWFVVLMISRNKDNKDVMNFKERRNSFLSPKNMDKIHNKFIKFVNEGLPNELCRLYISVNARNVNKVKKELLHALIDKDYIDYEHVNSLIAGIAARKENAAEKKWMFDFDSLDTKKLTEFLEDLTGYGFNDDEVEVQSTPHGSAIVVSHGFDTRVLLEKWEDIVTLKRDDLICVDWRTK